MQLKILLTVHLQIHSIYLRLTYIAHALVCYAESPIKI